MDDIRNNVYDWCLELMKEGKELQAIFLMLATWNFAYFRFHMIEFKLEGFKRILKTCNFKYFERLKIETADLNNETTRMHIFDIYQKLSAIKGIKYVGATKIMHLYCPYFFVMWDTKIRIKYDVGTSANEYFGFLQKMKELYDKGNFKKLESGVSVARAIDIYNMIHYSS